MVARWIFISGLPLLVGYLHLSYIYVSYILRSTQCYRLFSNEPVRKSLSHYTAVLRETTAVVRLHPLLGTVTNTTDARVIIGGFRT